MKLTDPNNLGTTSHGILRELRARDPFSDITKLSINCGEHGLSESEIIETGQEIGYSTTLNCLTIDFDGFYFRGQRAREDFKLLCDGIKENDSIIHLIVANRLGFAGVEEFQLLAQLLEKPRVEKFDYHGRSHIGLIGAAIANRSSQLEDLFLHGNGIGTEGLGEFLSAFAGALGRLPKLIDLGANNIGVDGCQMIAGFLQDPSCPIEGLDLSKNMDINDDAALYLAGALIKNKVLKKLNLYFTAISSRGWSTFLPALCQANSIQSTLESNHVIHSFGNLRHNWRDPFPAELKQLLEINGKNNKEMVARLKTLRYHFNGQFVITKLNGFDVAMLAKLIGFLDRSIEEIGQGRWTGIVNFNAVRVARMEIIYNMAKHNPSFSMSDKVVATKKRTRSGRVY